MKFSLRRDQTQMLRPLKLQTLHFRQSQKLKFLIKLPILMSSGLFLRLAKQKPTRQSLIKNSLLMSRLLKFVVQFKIKPKLEKLTQRLRRSKIEKFVVLKTLGQQLSLKLTQNFVAIPRIIRKGGSKKELIMIRLITGSGFLQKLPQILLLIK